MPRLIYRFVILSLILSVSLIAIAAVKFVSYAQKKASAPAAVTVADTQSDATTGNNDGKLQVGEKEEGTVTVSVTGSNQAFSSLNVPLDSHLTLDNSFGSNGVQVSPIAGADSYAATSNIQISQPTGAGSLLANDIDPLTGNSTGLTTTAQTISSTNCTGGCSGNVVIASDGSFTYFSPGNFTGTDTFNYTVTSASGGTATGIATVTVTDRVMFVSATGSGTNCRATAPCTLGTADAAAAPTGKDLVYVLSGTYNSAVFTMNASQNLVGQGVSLAQALSDAGITLAPLSVNPNTAASTSPTLNNAGTIVTLSTNNLVERFSINPSAGTAGIFGSTITTGTDTIRDLSVTATGAANGISLTNNTGGTFSFSGTALTSGASGIAFNATGGGTVSISNTNASSINAAGQAINVNGVTLNATLTSTNASGGTNGISLTGVSGTSNFGSGALSGASGSEFAVSGATSPSVSYTGTITQNNAQRVVDIQGTTGGTITLSGSITGGSSSLGVHIGDTSAVNGNVTFTTLNLGASGSRMTNQAVTISNGGSSATYSLGTINVFTNNASGLVANGLDGTLNVTNGNIDTTNTVSSNTGSAVNINGPAGLTSLGITFTSVKSGGGNADGMSIQNTNGSFTITGTGTTAASGGTFTGVANGADGVTAAGIGIYLNNVAGIDLSNIVVNGTWSNFGIRGDNVNGFGLHNSTVVGTFGTSNAADEDAIRFGVQGVTTGLKGTATFDGNTISGGWEDNMDIYVEGSDTLTLNIKGSSTNANATFNATQNPGTNGSGNDNLFIESGQNSTLTANLDHLAINGAHGDQMQIIASDNTTQHLTVTNSTFNNISNNANTIGGDVYIGGGGNTATYHTDVLFTGNTILYSKDTALGFIYGGDSQVVSLSIKNNTIGTNNGGGSTLTDGSGSKSGNGLEVDCVHQAGVNQSKVAARIDSNQIHDWSNLAGIALYATGNGNGPGGSSTGSELMETTIVNNNVSEGDAAGSASIAGLYAWPGSKNATDNGVIGLNLTGNTFTAPATSAINAIDLDSLNTNPNGHYNIPGYTVNANTSHGEFRPSGGGGTASTSLTGFWGGNNTLTPVNFPSISGTRVDATGTIGITANAFSLVVPTLPLPLGGAAAAEAVPHSVEGLGVSGADIAFTPVENVFGDVAAKGDPVAAAKTSISSDDQPSLIAELYDKLTLATEPTVEAQAVSASAAGRDTPSSTGITVNGGGSGFTISAGSSITIKYRATLNAPAAGTGFPNGLNTIDNTATANLSPSGTQAGSSSIPLDAAPDLSVAVTDGQGTTQPGVTDTYTFTYSNGLGSAANNLQDAAGATITVPQPATTTFNSGASTSGWACAAGTCTFSLTAAQVAVNTSTGGTTTLALDVPQLPAATATKIDLTGASIAETPSGANGTDLNASNNTAATDSDNIIGIWTGTTSNVFGTNTNWSNGTLPDTVNGQNIAIPTGGGANAPAITTGTPVVNNLYMAASSPKSLTITSPATLTVKMLASLSAANVLGNGTLIIDNGAAITRSTGQVNCPLQKNFLNGSVQQLMDAPLATFTYPVGTATGYFPVDVTPTAGSTGSLTVQAFDGTAGVVPPLDNTKTLQRYWGLASTGAVTADVKFTYGATATPGTEANYKPQRVTGGIATSFADNCPAGPCVDETNNFIFVPGTSSLTGNWTASDFVAAPTAATVSVSGRVFAAEGTPLRNARVVLDDGSGHQVLAITNAFGFYHFDEVQSGTSYLMKASARGYTFTPRVVTVNDQLSDIDMIALP